MTVRAKYGRNQQRTRSTVRTFRRTARPRAHISSRSFNSNEIEKNLKGVCVRICLGLPECGSSPTSVVTSINQTSVEISEMLLIRDGEEREEESPSFSPSPSG